MDENLPQDECSVDAPLTPRAKRFVAEYLKDFNGTRAAIRAGYSPRSARVTASKMLANVSIAGAVQRRLRKAFHASQVNINRIVRELSIVAFFDPGSIFDDRGRLLPIHEMPPEVRRGLVGGEVLESLPSGSDADPTVLRRVRFGGKLAALIALGKHHAIFSEQVAREGSHRIPITVARQIIGTVERRELAAGMAEKKPDASGDSSPEDESSDDD
jgi:phage terminase small subunit